MRIVRIVVCALAAACSGGSLSAQTLDTVRVASGLSLPLFVTAPRADFGRLFIVEQRSGTTGRIRILNLPAHTLNATPYLSISPVATDGEQGLLGLAFHPNFLSNGYFFVYYTEASGDNVVVRYRANAPFATSTTADAASAVILLDVPNPFPNHNGGWIGFAPGDTQGHLFIAKGDGGSFNDPNNNAQNINSLLGKILRVDVDGADNVPGNDDDDGAIGQTLPPYTSPASNPFAGATPGRDEIFAVGVRNPWRNAFDRADGRLFIADVGQDVIEEIDVQPGTTTGLNYGWRCMEGNNCTGLSGCTCNAPALRLPVQTYAHSGGACSITGGYVYRGCAIPQIQGHYFYADFCTSQISSFLYTGDGTTLAPAPTNRTADLDPGGGLSISFITSFGEDALGEMYILDQGGEVFKIVPASTQGPDCNGNGVRDECDIARGTSADADADGVPDECCPVAPATGLTTSEPSPGTATLMWTDNAGNDQACWVLRERRQGSLWVEGNIVAVLGANATTFTDAPGQGVWRYSVSPFNDSCEAPFTTPVGVKPAPPTNPAAANIGGSVQFTWADASAFETKFSAQRQQRVGSSWTNTTSLGNIPRNSTSLTNSPGPGQWRYRIRAQNQVGSSPYTPWRTITLP